MTFQNEERVELIALMGATGAGKSSFINHVLQRGEQAAEVNDGLESCTSEVTPMPFELDGFRGSIIDTPGFDDTYLSDTQILVKISNWLQMTHQNSVMVTGVLYLRDINEGRVTGSVKKNIRMFEEICGTESLENVVIVTTKWDIVPRAKGEAREQELMAKFFRPMLDAGAQQARHNDTLNSAQEVLRRVLGNKGRTLQLQSELVDGKKTLSQTKAGAVINEEMTKQYEEHEKEMEELKQQIEKERNEKKRLVLQREQDELAHAQALIEQDRLKMDADREQEMREYQARLDAVADKTGSSPTAVLLNGLAVGVTALAPVALQFWQQHKADQAKEKQADQAREDKIRQENVDREDRLKREEHDRHVKARQEETERDLARLRMQVDHQSQVQNNTVRVPGLFELLLGFH